MATLPDNNISVTLVKDTLSETSFSVGSLCSSTNINKWSKHKPVIYPSNSTTGITNWWKAVDGSCGLSFNVYTTAGLITTAGSFLYNLKNKLDPWGYKIPYGGELSPYRIGDFRGYYTDAFPAIQVSEDITVILSSTDNGFSITAGIVNAGNTYNISFNDILYNGVALDTYYFGVLIYNKSDNTYFAATSDTVDNYSVRFTNMRGYIGSNWACAYFLSQYPKTQLGAFQTGNLIAIDSDHSNLTIKDTPQLAEITLDAWWGVKYTQVNYRAIFTNSNFQTSTITNVVASFIYNTQSNLDPSTGTVLSTSLIGTVVIDANSSQMKLGNFTYTGSYDSTGWYYVGIKSDQLSTKYALVVMDAPPLIP